MDRAIQEVELCTAEIEVGKTYRGIVRGIKDFGAFVECLPARKARPHLRTRRLPCQQDRRHLQARRRNGRQVCWHGERQSALSRKAALEDAKEATETKKKLPRQGAILSLFNKGRPSGWPFS